MILGLRQLKHPHVAPSSGPPDVARIVHHGTDELLVEQDIIPDGEATPVQERTLNLLWAAFFVTLST
jgi:hypothetical protein